MNLRNTPSNDESLLENFQNGGSQAFEILVQRHAPKAYRIAHRVLNNPSEAEDIVQNAFLKLWQRPHLCDKSRGKKFTSWFFRVIVNACLDSNKRHRTLSLDAFDPSYSESLNPHIPFNNKSQKQRLLKDLIAELPSRQGMALTLCFYEGFSNQEASNSMGVSLKALESLLMRAKSSLKLSLKQQSLSS